MPKAKTAPRTVRGTSRISTASSNTRVKVTTRPSAKRKPIARVTSEPMLPGYEDLRGKTVRYPYKQSTKIKREDSMTGVWVFLALILLIAFLLGAWIF